MPPPSTPWSRRAGGLPSDRIPPPTTQPKPKGVQNKQAAPPPPSPAVKSLQLLISNLQNPKATKSEGCFCQARTHALATYTPNCSTCGLALCNLNQPYDPCPYPSCGVPLLSDSARQALVIRLGDKIAQTIADEQEAKLKEEQEKQRLVGAFPELAGGASKFQAQHQPTTHKVLSLTSKGAFLSTYTRALPKAKEGPSNSNLPVEPKEVRVGLPSTEPDFVYSKEDNGSKSRRYEDLRGEGMRYVPLPQPERQEGGKSRRRKKDGKKTNEEDGKKANEEDGKKTNEEDGPADGPAASTSGS